LGKINRLVHDMETSSTEFIDLLQTPAPTSSSRSPRQDAF